jgi:glutamate racemase
VLCQGEIVARKTKDYLRRHPEMERRISCGGTVRFATSDTPEFFAQGAGIFWKGKIVI